jgi:hypothetical protein
VSQETALAQQITKGQAREIMQKYMPVPETALQTHCSSLVSIAVKHKQMHIQVGPEPALRLSLFSLVSSRFGISKQQNLSLSKKFLPHTQTFGMLLALTKPHVWSYSGLYAPDSMGRHMFQWMQPALLMLPNSLYFPPVILESISS